MGGVPMQWPPPPCSLRSLPLQPFDGCLSPAAPSLFRHRWIRSDLLPLPHVPPEFRSQIRHFTVHERLENALAEPHVCSAFRVGMCWRVNASATDRCKAFQTAIRL